MTAPLRLELDGAALVDNWRWLARSSGAAVCGAAVKADGYGLGAIEVVTRLRGAGCRDFFVATWAEAAAIARVVGDAALSVLHGVRAQDMAAALSSRARPVLNNAQQVARWREAGGGGCDVMIDTGMNRLGLTPAEAASGLLDGLAIETLMSHLSSADEDSSTNDRQLAAFLELAGEIAARRRSIANSAGICLGPAFALDLTRPGLALYGGVARREAAGHIRQVVFPQADVLQVRTVPAGGSVGYNATWTARHDTRVAIINIGYADGYPRALSQLGAASWQGHVLKVIGRVSMDLVALAIEPDCAIAEGDRVALDFDLRTAAAQGGVSQYELLTNLGSRFDRHWID